MSEPGAGSAGALLRAAREQRGLHIAALAAAIKVAPRKLDALENDRWDELPDATFVRALAQTVCRTLKIDAAPILGLLPPAGATALEAAGGGLNMPFHDRPGREATGMAVSAIRPMVLAAGLLMVAAVVVYFLPSSLWAPRPKPSTTVVSVSPAASAVVEGQAASAASPASAAASVQEMAAALAASAPPPAPAPAPSAAVPSAFTVAGAASQPQAASKPAAALVAAANPPAPAASADASADSPIQLRASAPSWIEVRDGRGAVLLSRVVQGGEQVGLNGSPPIRVVVGNASATQLVFHGRPVDLMAQARDNVSRVELH